MTIFVKKNGEYQQIRGNPLLTNSEGTLKKPYTTILSSDMTSVERADYGVYDIDTNPPEGKRWAGEVAEKNGVPVAVFVDKPPEAPAQKIVGILQERRRRLALGFDYDFGDSRGVHRIGTTEDDHRGWEDVTKLSTAAILGGAPNTTINIMTDTGPVQVTAAEWQQIIVAAGLFGQPIWAASFALQAMDPIPENFTDGQWWP